MRVLKRKKLLVFIFILILFLLSCGNVPSVSATAETAETAREELNVTIEELLNELDLQNLQDYLDKLSQFQGISVKDKLLAVVSGDFSLDYSSIWNAIISLVWEEVQTIFPAFAVILAISLLCGILNSAKSGFLHSTMSDIIGFVGYISVGAVVLSCLATVLNAGHDSMAQMRNQMEIIYPVLLTLMSVSGGNVSVAVYRPAVAFMSGGITELFISVVLPISVVVIILSFVGNLSTDVKTEKLGDFFKSISKCLVGFSLGLFGIFLTVQGLASAQYDGLSLRAVKYVISGSVPIVGGFLSGSVDFIVAGSTLIKNALGAFSIFVLIGTLLKPLLLFAVFQLFLKISAAATEPSGGKIPVFLSKLSSDMGYFFAGLLCIAFLYFLTLLLLVCSSGVMF